MDDIRDWRFKGWGVLDLGGMVGRSVGRGGKGRSKRRRWIEERVEVYYCIDADRAGKDTKNDVGI